DVRSVAKAGARVTLAVVASLLALGAVSLGLIHVLGLV
ncbi:MAG: putative sulfate exporter family transporter, partial [Parafilimonas terrae]|nr:putative sulfate exporter family transporter [Parafilimonas terrae]